jgi:hypothetical protein
MANTMEIRLGAEVLDDDGPYGKTIRAVVDTAGLIVTHLVVEPTHRSGLGRLVPIHLLSSVDGQLRIHGGDAAFSEFELAEETLVGPASGTFLGFGSLATIPTVVDTPPTGEVAIRPDAVIALDGVVGHVQGVRTDGDDYHLTHVLLLEGHIWGRKEVAIPISSVKLLDDGVHTGLTKDELGLLPAADAE